MGKCKLDNQDAQTDEKRRRVAEAVCNLTERFAENSDEDAMIDAAADAITGDPEVDAEIVEHVHAIWLLMDATGVSKARK